MAGRTLPHDQRLNKARQWLPTYTGQKLVGAYHKKFGVDRHRAIMDLGELGVFAEVELAQLLRDERARLSGEAKSNEVNKHNQMVDEIESLPFEIWNQLVQEDGEVYYLNGGMIPWEDARPMLIQEGYLSVPGKKRHNSKNHVWDGDRLLQTNKKWGVLKESQKTWIHEQIKLAHTQYYDENNRLPMRPSKRDNLLFAIYERIEERGIWIPFDEFKRVACKAIARYNRREVAIQQQSINKEVSAYVR